MPLAVSRQIDGGDDVNVRRYGARGVDDHHVELLRIGQSADNDLGVRADRYAQRFRRHRQRLRCIRRAVQQVRIRVAHAIAGPNSHTIGGADLVPGT